MSKLARRNQAKQLRMHHREKQDQESHIFQGQDGAPKHVAVVPLSPRVDVIAAVRKLNEGVDLPEPIVENGRIRVRVDRFRRNLLYIPTTTDILSALDACKLADWVVFVMAADEVFDEDEDVFLRALEGQGITNVVAVVQGLEDKIPAPKRSRQMVELKLMIGRYFGSLDKISNLDSKSDCANLVRSLCTAATKGIRWRDDRSWMLIDEVEWAEAADAQSESDVVLTGIVRGRGLNPDRLVHVPGWGEFRVKRIVEIPAQVQKRKVDDMAVEIPRKEWLPTADQDDLAELAPEQPDMTDATSTMATSEHKGVLLDDHHYFSDDNSHIPPTPKKLPKGTSAYQAAWYLEDMSDSDSDILDEDNDGDVAMDAADPLGPEDGVMLNGADAMTDVGGTEYPESEMHVDANAEDEARQLDQYRASRKQEAEEDLEFPDEIELNPDVLARERLAKYRGLKSIRTSEWNTNEDAPYEPAEYKRLLQIADYKKSSSAAYKDAMAGGVPAGTKIELELQSVPSSLKSAPAPSVIFSLLRHEHKHAIINLNVTFHSSLEEPIRSKEELVVQIGHRRLAINPIFSAAGQTPNDVHKFDRFLHPGRTAIATFSGPVTWGSVPVLVFKQSTASTTPEDSEAPALVDASMADTVLPSTPSSRLKLIGSATTIPTTPSRVIAKRIILTGHPYKIHKRLVTIRYMFFNREDVTWFSALPLWTRRGRQGFIKEPLGTHGYLKATFDGKINPLDAVGVSLYKRMWPRPSRPFEA